MDAKKIQLLLKKHGKTPAIISRELSVSPSVVCRTIASHRCSSRRIRLHISKILGFPPSSVFDLPPQNQLYEDHLFCSELSKSAG